MNNPAQRYIQLRNNGLSHKTASELSGWSIWNAAKGALFWLAVLVGLLVWLSLDHRQELEQQAGYIKSMEKIINGCTDRQGTTLMIGDEVYVCRTFKTEI